MVMVCASRSPADLLVSSFELRVLCQRSMRECACRHKKEWMHRECPLRGWFGIINVLTGPFSLVLMKNVWITISSIHSSWVFIIHKKHSYSADSLHETLSRCVISCNCPFRSIARRISAGKQVPEKRCPWKKKRYTNRRNKREKPEHILENSNKSTDENIHVTVWPQQGRLSVTLCFR